jgi:hypothetical protein
MHCRFQRRADGTDLACPVSPRAASHHDAYSSADAGPCSRSTVLPVLPLAAGDHHEQGRRRRLVLALWRLRTDLESLAAGAAAARLVAVTPRSATLVEDLRELIAALDRRVPHLEREGERAIAHDAAELRAAAMKRLTEIERALAAPPAAVGADEGRA